MAAKAGAMVSHPGHCPASSASSAAGRSKGIFGRSAFFLESSNMKSIMIPSIVKKQAPPRMGDGVADLAARTSRMDSIEMRLGRIEAVLASPAMRQAIGIAVTTQAMRVRK
jgi:hypothetical protein